MQFMPMMYGNAIKVTVPHAFFCDSISKYNGTKTVSKHDEKAKSELAGAGF